MAGAVGDEADQAVVRGAGRVHPVQMRADGADDLQVGALVVAADVVALADPALLQHQPQGAGMVLDIEPVADVVAGAVDRQRLARQTLEDHQRDQLLREMVGAVIVGAVGQHHRQPVGLVPGADQMVARRLAGRIGRVGAVGGGFGEEAVVAQRAEHLVGGDVVEAEALLALRRQGRPIAARRFQQAEGADHVGLDELARPVDGAVDMGLGGQMHHRVGLVAVEEPLQLGGVADVDLLEGVARVALGPRQGGQVGRVGQLVDVDDEGVGFGKKLADHRRADETGAAGDENARHQTTLTDENRGPGRCWIGCPLEIQ